MNITPRKAEVEQVVALLEGGEHDTPEALAKDLIKIVATMLADRDTYGVAIGLKTDDLRIPHGPYYEKAEAKRVVARARDRGLVAYTAPLFPPARAEPSESAPTGKCQCGHPKELHHNKWGCCTMVGRKEECPCGVYTA